MEGVDGVPVDHVRPLLVARAALWKPVRAVCCACWALVLFLATRSTWVVARWSLAFRFGILFVRVTLVVWPSGFPAAATAVAATVAVASSSGGAGGCGGNYLLCLRTGPGAIHSWACRGATCPGSAGLPAALVLVGAAEVLSGTLEVAALGVGAGLEP